MSRQSKTGDSALLLFVVLAAAFCLDASAARIETVLMPGKVSTAHAKIESDCAACHDRTDRSRQTALCLDCHKEVAADVRGRRGLHGRIENVASAQCKACHNEHQGRDADIVKRSTSTFDHSRTDFRLDGAHRSVACDSCHESGKPRRAAPGTCVGCHKRDDRHAGQLGTDCGDCHSNLSWSAARFDHARTGFPLRDAHREIHCDACHLGGRYSPTPATCVGCHMPDDVHGGARGENCAECHTQADWAASRFDHAKETGFPLVGAHRLLACEGCHRRSDFKDDLPRNCIGCHRADDAHALRFGADCASCHGDDAWQVANYDHLGRHRFALHGAHQAIDCHACHVAPVKQQKLGTDCVSCHQAGSPHGIAFASACDSCHVVDGWQQGIRFDHDLTDWPLLGLHAVVGCGQCHVSKAFRDAPETCMDCHRQDDVHRGGLGRQCESCHSPNGWNLWEFDHGRATGFALTGRHRQVQCADCHRRPAAEVKLASDCGSCHRQDDIHLGQFGTQCQRCHTTLSFKGARIQ